MTDKELSEIACLLITLHGKDALDAALRLGRAHDVPDGSEGREFWGAVAQMVLRILEAGSGGRLSEIERGEIVGSL